jgi:hypothetical protein
MKHRRRASVLGAVALVAAAGCSSSVKKDVSQTVARNAVAVGMKKEFSDHGHPVKGVPTCRSTSVKGSNTKVDLTCTATTNKGERASLIGSTSGANEVRGTFTGSIDDAKIFTVTCIGC